MSTFLYSFYSDSCGEPPISKPRGPSVESDSGHGIALYQMFQLFLYYTNLSLHLMTHFWENLRTCPWACCRFVLQGCLESPELHNHWLLSMYHNRDMWHSIWAISNGQFLILPPWPFYVVVSVRSLGSFVGKNRQQFAWIRTARSTPWRDGGNVVLGLGSRGLTVVQQIKLLGIQFLQWFCIYACFFFMSTLG